MFGNNLSNKKILRFIPTCTLSEGINAYEGALYKRTLGVLQKQMNKKKERKYMRQKRKQMKK